MEIYPSVKSALVVSLFNTRGACGFMQKGGKKHVKMIDFCTLTVNTSAKKERKKKETNMQQKATNTHSNS